MLPVIYPSCLTVPLLHAEMASEEEFDAILRRAASPGTPQKESLGVQGNSFAYDEWLDKLSNEPPVLNAGAKEPDPIALQHLIAVSHSHVHDQLSPELPTPGASMPVSVPDAVPASAVAAVHAMEFSNYSTDPSITICAPSYPPPPPPPQLPAMPPVPVVSTAAKVAAVAAANNAEETRELLAKLKQAEDDLKTERDGRKAQTLELASLNRQVDFANAELLRLQTVRGRLESEASESRATEQAQRNELREDSSRHARDGAVIRSLQQREATLLQQLSGALRERDEATAAAAAHRADADSLRNGFSDVSSRQHDERRAMQKLVRENAELRLGLQQAQEALEAAQQQTQEARLAARTAQHAMQQQEAQLQQTTQLQQMQRQMLQQQMQRHPQRQSPPRNTISQDEPTSPEQIHHHRAAAVPSSPPPALPPPPMTRPDAPAQAPAPQPTLPAPQPVPRAPPPAPYAPQPTHQHHATALHASKLAWHIPADKPPPRAAVGAAAGAPRTAGMPANPQRIVSRRGAPAPRQPSFNLLSGERMTPPRASGTRIAWRDGTYRVPADAPHDISDAHVPPAAVVGTPPLMMQPEPPFTPPKGAPQPPPQAAPQQQMHPPQPQQPLGTSALHSEIVPYARDDDISHRATEAMAPLEKELMQLSMHKNRLDAEYARMPLSAGRTVAERREKALLEARIEEISKQIRQAKSRLRSLQPAR